MQLDRFTVSPEKINFAEVTSAAVKIRISGYPLYMTSMGGEVTKALEQLEAARLHKIGPHFVNPKRVTVIERQSTAVTLYFDGSHDSLRLPVDLYDESPVPTPGHKGKK